MGRQQHSANGSRVSKLRQWFLRLLIVFVLLLSLAAGAALWGWHEYSGVGPLTESKAVVFPRGTGTMAMADQLAEHGVIRYSLGFKVAAVLSGDAGRFKAGEYEFPAGVPLRDVISMLAKGDVVIRKITVPEGRTVRDIVEVLNAEQALTGEVPADISEGSLLPETYHFTYGDTRSQLVERMRKSMQEVLQERWAARQDGLPINDPQQALVLASIVEKETGVPSERGKVAAVYINRLRMGMRLQADPTVIYGIEVEKKEPMKRGLTYADLEAPTPYNTYVNVGLPPGPIANPGRASIEAVLNPPETRDIYFVADGKGGHVFAATLAEHNRNVAAYRAMMREAKQ